MNIARLIACCRERGIEFSLGEGTVKVRGMSEIVEDILPTLRDRKKEIVEYLSIEKLAAISRCSEYHDHKPVSVADVEIALIQTKALLDRVMSQRF